MAEPFGVPSGSPESLLGRVLELEVGAPAAGGACVARYGGDRGGGDPGRVVFVRHALPGERVSARVTEDRGGTFARADAIAILTPAPERVRPPCPYAGPGKCGGCDWQHASGAAQRTIKATVVRDQFARLARLDLAAEVFDGVEELPGGLLGWRTRVTYAVDRAGRPGLHRHASHAVEHVRRCLIGGPGIGDTDALDGRWPELSGVEVVDAGNGARSVLAHRPGAGRQARGRRPPDRVEVHAGPATVIRWLRGRRFELAAGGFWQVHPAAADTLAAAVLDAVTPAPGETVLDLYAGAGGFTAVLAEAVGRRGRVIGVEADARAVQDARRNLADLAQVEVRQARIDAAWVAGLTGSLASGAASEQQTRPDVVVLDPPRAGAGVATMRALLDLHPRAVAYVSCDPATLARDVAEAVRLGWQLTRLRAFDAFPMTQHVECLAVLQPATVQPTMQAPEDERGVAPSVPSTA